MDTGSSTILFSTREKIMQKSSEICLPQKNERAVRWATSDDKRQVFEIALSIHKENGLFSFSIPKFNALWESYENKSGGLCGVIGEEGHLEGAIFLTIQQPDYSDEYFLADNFLHVFPECRKTRNAINLIEFAKICATHLNIPLLLGIMSSKQMEAKVRLYRRKFGDPVAERFLYKPNGA